VKLLWYIHFENLAVAAYYNRAGQMGPAGFELETRGVDIDFLTIFVSRTPFKIWQNLRTPFQENIFIVFALVISAPAYFVHPNFYRKILDLFLLRVFHAP
jgi:hypothetical protein